MIVEATNCNRTYAAKGRSLASDFTSDVIDFKDMPMGSVQILWDGIVGALDGTWKIYCSNLPDISSFDAAGTLIDGAEITPHGASGARMWLRDRLGFRYALLRWTAGSVTAGNCDIIALGKKS